MSDNDEQMQEPWDAIRIALWEWRDRFDSAVQELRGELESTPNYDERIKLAFEAVSRAPEVFTALRDQRFTGKLEDLVAKFSKDAISLHGLDARRMHLVRTAGLSRLNLDAELIEYLVQLSEHSSQEMQRRYEALAVGALNDVRLNPIAEDYLKRSARLLLLGLDVECA